MKKLFASVCTLLLMASVSSVFAAESSVLFNQAVAQSNAEQELLVTKIRMAPGEASMPHRHNAHVLVLVLSGTMIMAVSGGEEVTLQAGDTFYESPGDVHSVSRNASDTEAAEFVAYILKVAGAPTTVPITQ